MKIFITGASGFVGGAVTKHLISNHEIFAMALPRLSMLGGETSTPA